MWLVASLGDALPTARADTIIDSDEVTIVRANELGKANVLIRNGGQLTMLFTPVGRDATAGFGNVTLNNGTLLQSTTAVSTTRILGSISSYGQSYIEVRSGFWTDLSLQGAVTVNTGSTLTADAGSESRFITFEGSAPITIASGGTLATAGYGSVDFGLQLGRTIVGQGTSSNESILRLGATSHHANSGTAIQVNGSGTGGLRIEGAKNQVDSIVTDARLAATTGTGGTLTLAYTDNGSRTLGKTANLSSASALALGLVSNGGTFSLGTAGGTTGDLANWGGLVVGANTTVSFNDNNVFSATDTLTMLGGKLALNGTDQTFSTLSVTGNSIIDFGASASSLNVSSISIAEGVILTIANWNDCIDYFTSLIDPGSSVLSRIVFTSFKSSDTHWESFDKQVTPVPEPATYGLLLMASGLGLFFWRRRQHAHA